MGITKTFDVIRSSTQATPLQYAPLTVIHTDIFYVHADDASIEVARPSVAPGTPSE